MQSNIIKERIRMWPWPTSKTYSPLPVEICSHPHCWWRLDLLHICHTTACSPSTSGTHQPRPDHQRCGSSSFCTWARSQSMTYSLHLDIKKPHFKNIFLLKCIKKHKINYFHLVFFSLGYLKSISNKLPNWSLF